MSLSYETWYLGDTSVSKGFLGEDQVYPPQEPERPPSEGLYLSVAGWSNGVNKSSVVSPDENKIVFNSDILVEGNEVTFNKKKSNTIPFSSDSVRLGEWFIISQNTGRIYGEFTEIVGENLTTITAKFKNLETMGSGFVENDYVNLGYFAYYSDPTRTNDEIWVED